MLSMVLKQYFEDLAVGQMYLFLLSILFDNEKCTTHKPIFLYNIKYFILFMELTHGTQTQLSTMATK